MTSGFRSYDLAYAAAVVSIGLIAGTALAHVFEMPHKMAMPGDVWLPIQSVIYNGWGQKLLYLDIVAIAGLTFCIIRNSLARTALLMSLSLLLIADIGIFLIWIAPANTAVDAWASITPDEQLGRASPELGMGTCSTRRCFVAGTLHSRI